MTKHYLDYLWKDGKPYGKEHASDPASIKKTYKIVADPYYKRISIEEYQKGQFSQIIYDSAIFDFRHLRPNMQNAWHKSVINETPEGSVCHIRNQDDRLILIEEYRFMQQLCRECRTCSPQGIPISLQKIFYTSLGDPFNGVILYDSNEHPVIHKRYQFDSATQEFTDLLEESWNT